MRRIAIAVVFCTLLLVFAYGEKSVVGYPADSGAAPVPKTTREKASYAIGLSIGQNMAQQHFDVDPNMVARGIADALARRDPLLTPEQVQAAMDAFQKELEAKEKAAGEQNKKVGQEFLAKNGKRKGVTTLKSGLQYEVIKAGTGPKPAKTDKVRTHYHGTLIDGKVFDSTTTSGEPADFGVGEVIAGWTEALQLMPVGSKWKLFVPSELAYGERGAGGVIAPNSVLIFELELLAIQK
jgi:FKBP-type peptidyl-prolyl cis-trans isomerase FklB